MKSWPPDRPQDDVELTLVHETHNNEYEGLCHDENESFVGARERRVNTAEVMETVVPADFVAADDDVAIHLQLLNAHTHVEMAVEKQVLTDEP